MKKTTLFCSILIAATALTACVPSQTAGKIESNRRIAATPAAETAAADQFLETLAPVLPAAQDLSPKSLTLAGALSLSDMVKPTATGDVSLDLSIPGTLRITRPEESISVPYDTYFITGTSNPDRPVYFEGEEIDRLGSKGTFGVLVSLTMGNNTFTFTQGDKTVNVSIKRVGSGVSKISSIQQDSMFPAIHGGAQVGGTIPVRCIAPSGAEVNASFGGKSVKLNQTAQANPGIPATFTGKLTVDGDYDSGVTTKIGPVTYKLSYGGATSSYESSGDMYIAGNGAGIGVKVTSYAGFVYPDLDKLYQFKDKVKAGASEYITDQNNGYFKLSSGGWIPADMVKIIEGETKVTNNLNGADAEFGSSRETYTFSGSRSPFYYSRVSDGVFYLTLYNTNGTPKPSVSSSRIFSSVSVTEKENNSIVYAFKLKEGAGIWGYDISFVGGDTVLKFNYKPKLSSGSTPLDGVRIMLDPGHGGTDPGALGVAGKTGPDEQTVNLAHAYAIRDELEALGARVTITREDNFFSLDDRIKAIEDWDADLFLSIHHNSIGVNSNGNKAAGMEIYYHTGYSKKLANQMMAGLSSNLNRNNRFVQQSYYRVTLMPYAPAILMELGFMSNPLEYEKATTQSQISQVADAVADGVLRTLQ